MKEFNIVNSKGGVAMKIIKPSFEILTPIDGTDILKRIEMAGRTCYKSEDKITDDSCIKFIRNLIKRGHESVIEHVSLTVKFICDRGVSHQIVRHRLASYSQESTRYCNYGNDDNGCTFIEPSFPRWCGEDGNQIFMETWRNAMHDAEAAYLGLLNIGATPEEARTVLPNSLKTEIVTTMNLRSWRHFFKERTSTAAHPQIRELVIPLLKEMQAKIPVVFDDIEVVA